MSFMAFPPEVNSALIYMGDGSSSLMSAAAAWSGLASDLESTSAGVANVVSSLGAAWQGPSMVKATAAITPYTTWLSQTSALAEQLGTQATTQAGLYETAYKAVISPALIAANRAQLLTLIATNFFGQNTPAIGANEATYAGYWATDGAAMDSYLAATQANVSSMTQPTNPVAATTNGGQDQLASVQSVAQKLATTLQPSDQTQVAALSDETGSALPEWLSDILTSGAINVGGTSVPLSTFSSAASFGSIPARFAMYPISMLMQLARMGQSMGTGASLANSESLMTTIGQFVDGKLQGAVGTLANHFTSATQAISAKLANASSLGALRVPEGWATAAQGVTRAAPVLPNAAVSAPTMASGANFPGGGFGQALMGALSGRGMSSIAAKVPKVVPRPSAGG